MTPNKLTKITSILLGRVIGGFYDPYPNRVLLVFLVSFLFLYLLYGYQSP